MTWTCPLPPPPLRWRPPFVVPAACANVSQGVAISATASRTINTLSAVHVQGRIWNGILRKQTSFQTLQASTLQNGGLVDCPYAESIEIGQRFPDTLSASETS